jgi:hypothetical protein
MRRCVTRSAIGFGLLAALAVALAVVGGCNAGDLGIGTSSSSSSSSNASAAGIWTGLDSATGLAMTGLVNANGQADFVLSNGVQYVGTAQVAGSALAITLDGYAQFGAPFADGSTYGVGTFNGTVTSASSITGTLSFTTSGSTSTSSSWSLTFSSLYDTAGPLSAVAGTYTDDAGAVSAGLDPLTGATVTVSSTGALSSQGASSSGCVLNGTISNENASYDVYQVSYTYEDCTGTYAVLNGVPFSGLANMNPNASPAQVLVAVTGQNSSGTDYGIVLALNAS